MTSFSVYLILTGEGHRMQNQVSSFDILLSKLIGFQLYFILIDEIYIVPLHRNKIFFSLKCKKQLFVVVEA